MNTIDNNRYSRLITLFDDCWVVFSDTLFDLILFSWYNMSVFNYLNLE